MGIIDVLIIIIIIVVAVIIIIIVIIIILIEVEGNYALLSLYRRPVAAANYILTKDLSNYD